MRTEDGHIIYKCLNEDSTAFGLLVDKYKASIFSIAYSMLRNFHDAEDVTQDVFIKAYKNLSTLRRWDNFLSWLCSIAYNLCRDRIKAQSIRKENERLEQKTQKDLDEKSVNSYREEQVFESFHEALDSLPDIYREVLTLHYLGGISSEQIARILSIPYATVRQRLSRARTQLREEILTMVSETYEQQRLKAIFTFRIVEMVKRIKVNPVSTMKGLPWGLSLATGIMIAFLGLGTHLNILSNFDMSISSSLSGESKVLKVGEFPVDVLKVSNKPVISNGSQNVLFMAPQDGDTWTKKADMPTAGCGACSGVVNGKIYVFCRTDSMTTGFPAVEEYNPITDTWTKKKDMKTLRGFASASMVDGKIYVIGGATPGPVVTSLVEEYDPATDTWTRKADLPTARFTLSSSVANGKIYAIGGFNGGDIRAVEEYDPKTDTWKKKSDMLVARQSLTTCEANGKIYAIGGWNGNNGSLASVEEYDPATDTWTKKSDMSTPRNTAVACTVNGMIYVIGGNSNWNPNGSVGLSTVEMYDPTTDKWTMKADIPTPRQQFCASELDGYIYAFGGSELFLGWGFPATKVISNVEAYDTGFHSSEISNVKPNGKLPTTWGEMRTVMNR